MKGIAKGVTPINTGKVLIGCMYLPRKPHYATEAELWVQDLLLRGTKSPTSVSLFARRLFNLTRALCFWK